MEDTSYPSYGDLDYNYAIEEIQPAYMFRHLVASIIIHLSSILTNIVLIVVVLAKPELRKNQNKWFLLTFAGTLIFYHILGVITETDRRTGTSVIDKKLCTFVFVLLVIALQQIRYVIILINIAAIAKALGKEISKIAAACLIFGSIILSIIHSVVFLFGIGNGLLEINDPFYEHKCFFAYDIPNVAWKVDSIFNEILYPLIIFTFAVLLGVFYKRIDQADRGHHLSILVADLAIFVMGLPIHIFLVIINFHNRPLGVDIEHVWYILTYIVLLSYLITPLLWLWVCPKMRSAYRQICCCCCPQTPEDEEKMVLLK